MKYKRLEWSNEYSVNEPTLDRQHQEFLDIGNEIITLAEDLDGTKDDLLLLLIKLADNINQHFDLERKFLNRLQLPGIEEHVEQHSKHRETLERLINEVRDDNSDFEEIADKVAPFVTDWVTKYMMGNAGTEKFFEVWRGNPNKKHMDTDPDSE